MSRNEMLVGALKRVNALTKRNGKLYHDSTGYFVVGLFDSSSRSFGEMLAYLHGIEDTLNTFKLC